MRELLSKAKMVSSQCISEYQLDDKLEFPELQALVSTIALIICGTTLIPALFAAIRNGDWAAVPVLLSNIGSSDGIKRVIMRIEMTS